MIDITKREGDCDESTFWACVAEIQWPVENNDLVKAEILRAWTPEFGTAFRKILTEKENAVYKAVEDGEKHLDQETRGSYYLSDDGLSDFCAHVVGMGWAVFSGETRDPAKLFKRAADHDYKENFSYVVPYEPSTTRSFEDWAETMGHTLDAEHWRPDFHHPDETFDEHVALIRKNWSECILGDWAKIEPDHYAQWAAMDLPGIAAFLAELENPSTQGEVDAIEFAATLTRYFSLLVNEKTDEAVAESEDALRAWWGLYHLAENVGALRSAHRDLLPMAGAPHGGENLINDHREFMGGLSGFKCRFHLNEIKSKAS